MGSFDHERRQVYQLALEFIEFVEGLVSEFPQGHADLTDQLRRASGSVVLNTAEGAGEFSKREKARFYRMARRSGTECAAVLDISLRRRITLERQVLPGKAMLVRIVSMLVVLIQRVGQTGTGTGRGTGTGKKG